jgi:hypothetical protein
MAALVTFAGACAANSIPLRVITTPMIDQILRIAGADQVVVIAKTVDEALTGFAALRYEVRGDRQ